MVTGKLILALSRPVGRRGRQEKDETRGWPIPVDGSQPHRCLTPDDEGSPVKRDGSLLLRHISAEVNVRASHVDGGLRIIWGENSAMILDGHGRVYRFMLIHLHPPVNVRRVGCFAREQRGSHVCVGWGRREKGGKRGGLEETSISRRLQRAGISGQHGRGIHNPDWARKHSHLPFR